MRTLAKTAQKIGVFFLFAGLCASLASCCEYNAKYDAVLYDDGSKYLQESFMEENPVTTTTIYQPDGSSYGQTNNVTVFVNNQETFELTFREDTGFKMDFEKRVAIIHACYDWFNERLYFRSISLKERHLRIDLENHHIDQPGHGGWYGIYERWIIVTMAKKPIDTVEVVYHIW